jgi:hypothetical protein
MQTRTKIIIIIATLGLAGVVLGILQWKQKFNIVATVKTQVSKVTSKVSGTTTQVVINTVTVQPTSGPRSITISASDPLDQLYTRDYHILDGENNDVVPVAILKSGSTWNVQLQPGTYKLKIGQSGGSAYGSYAGSITGQGVSASFSGLDNATPFTFAVI